MCPARQANLNKEESMMLAMSMSTSLRQEQRLKMSTQLKQAVQLTIETVLTIKALCPQCGKDLEMRDIEAGWNDDPLDFTTQCPRCDHRFVSEIVTEHRVTKATASYSYLCPSQLFHALERTLSGLPRRRLGQVMAQDKHPQLFWNMIRHHGDWKKGMVKFKAWNRNRQAA